VLLNSLIFVLFPWVWLFIVNEITFGDDDTLLLLLLSIDFIIILVIEFLFWLILFEENDCLLLLYNFLILFPYSLMIVTLVPLLIGLNVSSTNESFNPYYFMTDYSN
jgi:hypothetical protein